MTPSDAKVLKLLMRQGRATWLDVARELGLSAPAAAERVRRLEREGMIRGYAALVDPAALGYGLTAFVMVTLGRPQHRAPFLRLVRQSREIAECHHVAGEDDYFLKVRCRDTSDLERLISTKIKGLRGIARTRTIIVLRTEKESVEVPVESGE